MALEQIGNDTVEGCIVRGLHTEVIAAGATKTLLARDAGATVLLDTATGSVITLPVPVAGMEFDFYISTSVTSNSHQINTDAATTFIGGAITMVIDTSATSEGQVGDETSHVTITMNGSTTGGLKGSHLKFKALSSTVWIATGIVVGSGTLATPYA